MAHMVARIQAQLVAVVVLFLLGLPTGLADESQGILAQYSFDDDNIETGPDTFAVYEAAKGTVELSDLYRYSGYQSVEIRDVANDQDFPELQGYFALRKKGRLYAHFAFLVTNPLEQLNIALAGPKWFSRQKDGIAFWLSTRDGTLYHYSDSIPKKLLPLSPFVWYVVDVNYDIDNGRYDLRINQEGEPEPVVQLRSQPNATNAAGSAVDKFSFIGDTGRDVSNTLYYVYDVVIGTDERIVQQPFVAPGRRKMFFDMWYAFQKKAKGKPVCLPAFHLREFGITPSDYPLFKDATLRAQLNKALSGRMEVFQSAEVSSDRILRLFNAITAWNRGCQHLSNSKAGKSLAALHEATHLVPDSNLYRLSYALAKAAAGNGAEAEADVSALYGVWPNDSRLSIALAMIGMANAELYKTEYQLRAVIDNPDLHDNAALILNRGPVPSEYTSNLGSGFPLQWRQGMHSLLVSEQYFMVLLWQGKYQQARDFALGRVTKIDKGSWLAPLWYERAGDAVYLSGDQYAAINLYETSMSLANAGSTFTAKLSDLYYQIGDLQKERKLREKIYGTLQKKGSTK